MVLDKSSWMWGDEPFSWFQVEAIVGMVTAVATLATLVWAVVVTLRAERRAERAEGRERERAQRAQASRVTVYKGKTAPSTGGPFKGITWPVIKVNNASDEPIFAVTVHGSMPYGTAMTTLRSERMPSVPPGSALDFRFPKDEYLQPPEQVAWVAVTFRDADEMEWVRTETGRLTRVPDDPVSAERLLSEQLSEQWTQEARDNFARALQEE